MAPVGFPLCSHPVRPKTKQVVSDHCWPFQGQPAQTGSSAGQLAAMLSDFLWRLAKFCQGGSRA